MRQRYSIRLAIKNRINGFTNSIDIELLTYVLSELCS